MSACLVGRVSVSLCLCVSVSLCRCVRASVCACVSPTPFSLCLSCPFLGFSLSLSPDQEEDAREAFGVVRCRRADNAPRVALLSGARRHAESSRVGAASACCNWRRVRRRFADIAPSVRCRFADVATSVRCRFSDIAPSTTTATTHHCHSETVARDSLFFLLVAAPH